MPAFHGRFWKVTGRRNAESRSASAVVLRLATRPVEIVVLPPLAAIWILGGGRSARRTLQSMWEALQSSDVLGAGIAVVDAGWRGLAGVMALTGGVLMALSAWRRFSTRRVLRFSHDQVIVGGPFMDRRYSAWACYVRWPNDHQRPTLILEVSLRGKVRNRTFAISPKDWSPQVVARVRAACPMLGRIPLLDNSGRWYRASPG
ncbi:MAG: hypothetical protein OXU20_12685 [Myxococcales bacterium]|nr:hypothetical protein [Myxococcales bacterium]